MSAPEDHVAVLQARIRERLDAMRPLAPESDGYVRAAASVLEATAELIDYEERLPVLVDEPRRRLSVAVVRWSGIVTVATAVLLGLCTIPGWVTYWWLALLVPVALVGLRLLLMPVPPAGGPHAELRVGAAVIAASSPVTVLAAAGVVSRWAAVATVVMVGVGIGLLSRDRLPAAMDGDRPPSDPDAPTPPTGLVMPP
jgi:hypothetical protein